MEGTPGLELLFCSAKSQFKSNHDVGVCLLHWNFIANNFRCIGTGEESTTESEFDSELLPEGWNQSSEVYTLHYKSTSSDKDQRYLLKVVVTDNSLIVNLMNLKQEKLASKIIKTSDYVSDDWNATFTKAFKNVKELKTLFNDELLKEVTPSPTASIGQEREPRRPRNPYEDDDDPLRIPSRFPDRQRHRDPMDPFNIGRADLDPFADGGGGMFFDPFRSNMPRPMPGHLPRGAIPPGARYDPIGPGGRRSGPDPDHMPLPNSSDYDDMFM